ncbi:hypothetical protein [Saccharospirillum impatiens]|uniref:hypothetical protein n=1 Tax=Saccharospirillum impatiens TaxID=169438 RepID=UPI00041BB364|nr:hypothetical protein [Saccharospirillum impatiens]
MKEVPVVVSVILLLGGCAATNSTQGQSGILYQEFRDFQHLVETDLPAAKKTKVAADYVKVIEEADSRMPEEFRSPFFVDLANRFRTVDSHYEDIDGSQGCLTINGLNQEGAPESLSLYYVQEKGGWVFDYIMTSAHESVQEYYTEATCPDAGEYRR